MRIPATPFRRQLIGSGEAVPKIVWCKPPAKENQIKKELKK